MIEHHLTRLLGELGLEVLTKTSAGWLVLRCPFAFETHASGEDNSPSFTVKIEPEGLSAYNCFSCKEHGNIPKLVKKLGFMRGANYSKLYTQAVMDELPGKFSDFDSMPETIAPPREINEASVIGMFPLAWEAQEGRAYLKARGIGAKTSSKLGLLYDDDQCRILFPVRSPTGGLHGFTGRSVLSEREIRDRSEHEHLYRKIKDYAGLEKSKALLGAHAARPGYKKFVVEGLFAYAHVIEEGLDRKYDPLATLGSNLSNYQRDMLVDWDEPVILCYDDDLAGDEGLFGPLKKDGTHKGGGAVDKLKKHIPVSLFMYAKGRNEVDDLTYAELVEGIEKYAQPC